MPVPFDSSRYLLIVTTMLASLTIPVAARSAEWTAEPSVRLTREYNDNLRLSIFPQKSVNGSIISPRLDLGVAMPVWQIGFGAEATQRRYSGQEGLDRDDSQLRLSSLYRAERSTWQLGASRRRDSVVTSEQVDSDTGASQSLTDRETDTISPSWMWMFSQRTQLQLAYQQADVAYDDSQNTGLYDYRYRVIIATLANNLSVRNQAFITAGYSEYDVLVTGYESETRNLQVGLTTNFTESTRGTLQAGRRRTESFTKGGVPIYTFFSTEDGIFRVQTGVTQDTRTESRASVYSGNFESISESSDWNLSFSRALQPSGSGEQQEQDRFTFQFNKRLTPRLATYVNGDAMKVRTLEGDVSNNNDDREYYALAPGISWQWTREWTVGTNYRYTHVKREFENEAAESNSVNLWLTYRPLKISISR